MPPISEKESVENTHKCREDAPIVRNCTENRKHLIPTQNPKTLEETEKTVFESGEEDWVDVGDTNEEEEWVDVHREKLSASCWWPSIASTPTPRARKLL